MDLIPYFAHTFFLISLLCNVFTSIWRRCFMHFAVFCTLSYSTWFYICHSTIRARAPVMSFMPSFHPNSIKRTDFISRKLQPTWFWGAAKTSQCWLSLGWWDRAPGWEGAFNRTKYLDKIAQTWVAKICTQKTMQIVHLWIFVLSAK